jgi:hypothetical protein
MKSKIIILSIIAGFFSYTALGQDTSENQTYHISTSPRNYTNTSQQHIYRDTRLGGSSPLYNTYKKNDYGAGAITTNPHKTGSSITYDNSFFDSSEGNQEQNTIYRDTRLGGSSPGHRTYKTNDYGAGAITTNPNK